MSVEETRAASTAKSASPYPLSAKNAQKNAPAAAPREIEPGKSNPATNATVPPRSAAERGAIRVWRCGVPAEACDADGTHASEEACLRCVERHVPRVSPALRDVGDARVWLAPIARPGDVALGSATPRPRGDGEPLTESDVSDACFSSELARSESGQSLLHETDAFPEFSCCLVRNGTYVPTPGWLGYRNAGRAAPLLSVDPDVLRRDAATLSAEARRANVSDRPPGADDPALPEYEFAGTAANAFTIPNPPIFSEEEAELRARRVARPKRARPARAANENERTNERNIGRAHTVRVTG